MSEEFEQFQLGDEPESEQATLPPVEPLTALLETDKIALVQKTIESKNYVPNQTGYQLGEDGIIRAEGIVVGPQGIIVEGAEVGAPLSGRFTCGEDITAQNAVAISDGTITSTFASAAGNTNRLIFGRTTDGSDEGEKWGQSFTTGDVAISIKVVTISLDKVGSPADNVQVSIQGNSSSAPDGTPIGSTPTLSGGSISGSLTDYDFTLSTPATLSPNTTYWLVVERTGAGSLTAYYRADAYNGGDPYTGGLAKVKKYAGGSWDNAFGNTTSDARFILKVLVSAGTIMKASSVTSPADGRSKNFIGFAQETVSSGGEVLVILQGICDFTSLSSGSQYYLADSFGQISTSVGTVTRKVGIAVNTTQLLITNIW